LLADNKTFIDNPDKLIKAAVKRAYKQKYGNLGIDRALYQHNYRTLLKAIEGGMNKDFGKIKFGTPDWEFTQNLKYNIAVFSAFKNHSETATIASLLTDKQGRIRPWKDFRNDALKVSEKYNKTWLKAEYNRANRTARTAKDWQRYQSSKKLYPNLRYVATKDERTRDDHMQLDGAIYPINHSFWDTYYPPNDWGCRCRVEPTADDEVSRTEIAMKPDFKNNPGKTARIFTPDHPYFKGAKPEFKQRIKEFVERNIRTSKDVAKQMAKYNAYSSDLVKQHFNPDNGGYVVLNKGRLLKSSLNKQEKAKFKKEVSLSTKIADNGNAIELIVEPDGVATSDALLNGALCELKSTSSANNIYKYGKDAWQKKK